jgi:hypothetical protein
MSLLNSTPPFALKLKGDDVAALQQLALAQDPDSKGPIAVTI